MELLMQRELPDQGSWDRVGDSPPKPGGEVASRDGMGQQRVVGHYFATPRRGPDERRGDLFRCFGGSGGEGGASDMPLGVASSFERVGMPFEAAEEDLPCSRSYQPLQ